MRVLVSLLVLAMFVTSACKPLARTSETYEETEEKKRMSWKKKALIVAATGVAVFGSYKLVKYFDRILGIRSIEEMQLNAVLTRPLSKNFKIEHDKLPLYKLVAPDGSEHWLLGTMHTTGLSIDDLPDNSRLLKAFKETTVHLPETDTESLRGLLRIGTKTQRMKIKMMKADFNLRQALGDEHMDKLNEEIAEIVKQLKESGHQLDGEVFQILAKIDQMQPSHALGVLDGMSLSSAFGHPGIEIDTQLIREARIAGKKIVGLEKYSKTSEALVKVASAAQPNDPAAIERLRRFIAKGGVANRIAEYDAARAAYVNGDINEANNILSSVHSNELKKIILSDRNQNWMKSGKIQKKL